MAVLGSCCLTTSTQWMAWLCKMEFHVKFVAFWEALQKYYINAANQLWRFVTWGKAWTLNSKVSPKSLIHMTAKWDISSGSEPGTFYMGRDAVSVVCQAVNSFLSHLKGFCGGKVTELKCPLVACGKFKGCNSSMSIIFHSLLTSLIARKMQCRLHQPSGQLR